MVKCLLTASRTQAANAGISTAGSTRYSFVGNSGIVGLHATEVFRQVAYRSPGRFSKLYVRVASNTTSAESSVTIRKNGADTGMSVSIPAATDGEFTDLTHILDIVAGDKLSAKVVSGGTGTFSLSILSVVFDADTNSVTKNILTGFNVSSATTSTFEPISGYHSAQSTTDTNSEQTIKVAGTAKNAYFHVSSNARTTNTTITLRKNQTDTAISVTYAAGETGVKEDTSNTVSYSPDDEINWEITTSTGSETMSLLILAVEYETTTSQGLVTAGTVGSAAEITLTPGTTNYLVVGGGAVEGITTESEAQMIARERFTLSNLTVRARVNTVSANSTVRLRKNGANGNQLINIGPGATGFISDNTNLDTFEVGDTLDYQIITGATGTLLTISQLAVITKAIVEQPVIGGAIGGSRQGRSPLYRTVKPKAVAVIIKLKIQLQYEVTKLTITVAIPYKNLRPRPAIKYASAIIGLREKILPLRTRPTPKPVIRTITTQVGYQVQNIQLKSACAYEVDKLITRQEQTKLRTIAINFLVSDT